MYGKLAGTQIGIGYYESVGDDASASSDVSPAVSTPSATAPQVVAAPAVAVDVEPLTTDQKAARSALGVMALFGTGVLAVWAGYRMTESLRGRRTA